MNRNLSNQQFHANTLQGGATRRAGDLSVPTKGYAVGGKQMPERTFDLDKFTVGDVDNHLDDIRNQFQGDPKVSQGSWVTGNKAVLDASDVYQHKGQAILHGLLRRQDAVYDIQRGKDINLPHRKRSQ